MAPRLSGKASIFVSKSLLGIKEQNDVEK